jgi:glycosyltransferase involved in cell wall biosynthesis
MGKTEDLSNTRVRSHQVLWLPGLPAEGSLSMDRYWSELDRCWREHPPAGLTLRSVLGKAPLKTRRLGRLTRFWEKYVLYPAKVRRQSPHASLVHLLDHANARLFRQVPASVPKIATVHDLAPLIVPGNLTAGQQERFRQSVNYLREADLVLTDSKHTASDVIKLIGCKEERIRVLALGVNLTLAGTPQPAPLPDWETRFAGHRVVISVGATAKRKNLALLPTFFDRLKRAGWPVVLLRIGDRLPDVLTAELRAILGEQGLLELGKVSSEDLTGAYQRAALLIFPSRLEGFGLPVLEAMAAGCPVVCSNASSLPEVGGDAALYFDPDDANAAVAHAEMLLGQEEYRRERIRTGLLWSGRFSWQAHFDRLTDVYRELLESGPAKPARAG